MYPRLSFVVVFIFTPPEKQKARETFPGFCIFRLSEGLEVHPAAHAAHSAAARHTAG